MTYAVGVVALLAGLVASIALHEYGHYAAARRFGVKVVEFMVGFGPRVWVRRRGETEVGLRLIPLGGYIRMIGMYPPHSRLGAVEHGSLAPADRDRTFHSLDPWRKVVIMIAGPLMNLLLGVVLLTMATSVVGLPAATLEVGRLTTCAEVGLDCESTSAQDMGLRPGDRIVALAGRQPGSWDELVRLIDTYAGERVDLTVQREGRQLTLQGMLGGEPGSGHLGIAPGVEYRRTGVAAAVAGSADSVVRTAAAVVSMPARLYDLAGAVFGVNPRDPSGPIGVVGLARISGELAAGSAGWRPATLDILLLLAGLNLSLFVFNLIPLVPLDGGNALVALFEMARRAWARWFGRTQPPAVDGAALLPLTYTVAFALLAMAVLVTIADVVKPLTVG